MLVPTITGFLSLTALLVQGSVMPQARAESHKVQTFHSRWERITDCQLVNNCGSGKPVFIYRDSATKRGSTTISGPLYGGVAWMDGYKNCQMSGVNCGIVEFTLINPITDPANTQNSADYSLQSMGNHLFQYKMNFKYTSGCTKAAPGACNSASNCPGAFKGTDPASGTPVNCVGTNAGITITFC